MFGISASVWEANGVLWPDVKNKLKGDRRCGGLGMAVSGHC